MKEKMQKTRAKTASYKTREFRALEVKIDKNELREEEQFRTTPSSYFQEMKEHIKALRKRFGADTVNRALNFESGDASSTNTSTVDTSKFVENESG